MTSPGKRFDAVSTVKAGYLLFAPIGQSKTATGKTTLTATIDRADAGSQSYSTEDRGRYNGCEATWHDKASATHHTGTSGRGGIGATKLMHKVYHNAAHA